MRGLMRRSRRSFVSQFFMVTLMCPLTLESTP